MHVLYALQLKLWLRSNPVSKSFIMQIGHRPRASNSKQGPNKDLKNKQGRIMTILELQYDADAKRLYLKLTRNSFCIFFPANDIVSYREFISSPLHVRLKQLCPARGPVEGFVWPILSFSCNDKVSYILSTTSYFDNLQFAIFDAGSSQYHVNQRHNEGGKGGTIPRAPYYYGAPNDYRAAEKSQQWHKHFLQYPTFTSKISQVRTWGRQTCFLPQAPSNLVTPLTLTRLLPLQLRFECIQYISFKLNLVC